jgi:CRISPR-associated protein Cas1
MTPMAASLTVPQVSSPDNSHTPTRLVARHGVLTLFGYGINVRLDRGHLVVEDGIGSQRRRARLPRVGHGLRRLIVIGSDGMVSLAAIRWLADQKAAFVMLNRNGSVLVATGPVGPRDARLRRAQALAHISGIAVPLTRDLIDRKLAGQERNVRRFFNDESVVAAIAEARERLPAASTIGDMRVLEARAALAYWGRWRALPVMFPKADLPRVPEHWRTHGTRISPLTASPRLSVNPSNAMLNYLYAVIESEARLAASTLGLDPGLGVMHMDADARDSLASDLMEPVRPLVDEYVLNWLLQQPLKREWFFEERNGRCRLMGRFAERLSETAPRWAQAIAPIAEHVVKGLWSTTNRAKKDPRPATRLTQQHRREANGSFVQPIQPPQRPPRLCRSCGVTIPRGEMNCAACAAPGWREAMRSVAAKGRLVAHTPQAQAGRVVARRRNARAEAGWKPSDQPAWLTERVYLQEVQPRLATMTATRLSVALHVSKPYAADIRAGRRCPHRRHWLALATLVDVSATTVR